MTLVKLSEKAGDGLSVPYLSELERGEKQPPLGDNLLRLATALGMDGRELQLLALQSRRKLEIDLVNATPAKVQLAALLARRAEEGGLTDDEAQQIIKQFESHRTGGL